MSEARADFGAGRRWAERIAAFGRQVSGSGLVAQGRLDRMVGMTLEAVGCEAACADVRTRRAGPCAGSVTVGDAGSGRRRATMLLTSAVLAKETLATLDAEGTVGDFSTENAACCQGCRCIRSSLSRIAVAVERCFVPLTKAR